MDVFPAISVAFSMILGLGVTRLLASSVAVFRSRAHARLDWIPVAWAACIFMQQLQFWWAIIELHTLVTVWTLGAFLLLVSLALLLFVAAALVLPAEVLKEEELLSASFQRDGRWALAALAAYNSLALGADLLFWGPGPTARGGLAMVPMIVLPVLFLLSRSRRAEAIVTGCYAGASVVSAWLASPSSY